MESDYLKQKMDQTKDMVLNRILIVLLFFMAVGITISMLRISDTGFKFIYGVQIFLAIVVVLLFAFNKKINTLIKGTIFLFALYAMGISSLYSFGLYGFGYTYFIPASALAFLYYSKRNGWIITIASLMLLAFFAFAHKSGILFFRPENPHYMETIPMWMNMIITVLLISIVITMFWNNLYSLLSNTFKHIQYQQSDMKKMNDDLIVARDSALQSDKLKSSFLQNISHEIRTPLNIIIGFSDMVSQTDNPDEHKEFNTVIRDNCNTMLKIVNDIVDFSKIETNSLNINKSIFNVKEVIDKVEIDALKKKTDNINFNIEKIDVQVETDKERFQQIILNILDNAFKFTNEGEVELKCKINGKELLFTVNDTGIGIPETEHENIFERFYRIDPFSGGAGLGLSLSKSIANYIGGEVKINPAKEKGSSFTFTLPYQN